MWSFSGIVLAGVRCYVLHCVPLPEESPSTTPLPQPASDESPLARGTLDLLVGHENKPDSETPTNGDHDHHQEITHQHHHQYHDNHKKKRISQCSHTHTEDA